MLQKKLLLSQISHKILPLNLSIKTLQFRTLYLLHMYWTLNSVENIPPIPESDPVFDNVEQSVSDISNSRERSYMCESNIRNDKWNKKQEILNILQYNVA